MLYKETPLEDICDFPPINSGITERFIRNNVGDVPVYGSRKDGKPIGYIKDGIKDIRYFQNCLSWNRNGSVGYTFYRDHKFVTTDDHRPLIVKDEYAGYIDNNFLRFAVQNSLFSNGFSWGNKAGKDKIKLISISIPIDGDGKFDLVKQKEIANKYLRLETLKEKVHGYIVYLKGAVVKSDEELKYYKTYEIKDVFEIFKGEGKYTHNYFNNNKGEYPVYSGATKDEGLISRINTYDWDTKDETWLTWTTDGVYAGTTFVRKGKFSMNTHCGLLIPKGQFKNNINISYLAMVLNKELTNYAVGDQNKRVTVGIIKEVVVKVPTDKNGNIDLKKQIELANRYENVEHRRNESLRALNRLMEYQVNFSEIK